MAKTNRILIIVTNVPEYRKVGYRTGLWLGELTHFWDVAEHAGYKLDIASPSGGTIPLDPESLSHESLSDLGTDKRYIDRAFMDRLKDTKKVSEVKLEDYDGIYLTGGHGVMFDFTDSKELAGLIARFYETGRVVSAVCHGLCGLLNVKLSNGEGLLKGKDITGFSWPEEVAAKRDMVVPFNLEEELKKRGAKYTKADKLFGAYARKDGRLITGQNPASARAVGEAVVAELQRR